MTINTGKFRAFAETHQPYDTFKITMHLEDIAAGIPCNPDLIASWINATNKEKSGEERQALIDATIDELGGAVGDDVASKSTTVFKRDGEKGLYIEGRQIKAMLREAANIIKDDAGIKAMKSKLADQTYVVEQKVYLGRTEPDRIEERPVHAMTPQGPRSSLKRCEIVEDTEITFTFRRYYKSEIYDEAIFGVLLYAQPHGLGADRSQHHGRFVVKDVVQVEEANSGLTQFRKAKAKA